jgi:hypothetical protein
MLFARTELHQQSPTLAGYFFDSSDLVTIRVRNVRRARRSQRSPPKPGEALTKAQKVAKNSSGSPEGKSREIVGVSIESQRDLAAF